MDDHDEKQELEDRLGAMRTLVGIVIGYLDGHELINLRRVQADLGAVLEQGEQPDLVASDTAHVFAIAEIFSELASGLRATGQRP